MKEKIIRKWFWVWEFEKEEKWLDDMAKQGWVLDGTGFCKYRFVPCEPGEYTVRLELMQWHPHTEQGQQYISFVEETGAEYVSNYMRWAYFRKRTKEGAFDLFSDIDSRIKHLDGITKMMGCIALANLLIGMVNLNRAGLLNIACAGLLGYGIHRIDKMKKSLQEERKLHE
ncbi:MAG: DUF2812 domain-containing protein [Clostridia bacterium]|nr:DUF2812 domain-containing protein [Clostridia bacterium]